MLISFGWASAALLSGEKTTTLREWDDGYASRFRAGQMVDAWDRGPRQHGHKIATLQLQDAPRYTRLGELIGEEEELWRSEGFAFYERHPEHRPKTIWGRSTTGCEFDLDWFTELLEDRADDRMYLVRFAVVSLVVMP